jgi:hypothetical protein
MIPHADEQNKACRSELFPTSSHADLEPIHFRHQETRPFNSYTYRTQSAALSRLDFPGRLGANLAL